MRRRLTVLLLVIVGCGSSDETPGTPDAAVSAGADATAGADAGPPILDLGSGTNPTVAVDPAGAGHLAWIGTEATTTTLHFCRIPRGGSACEVRTPIATEGTSLTRPFVVVSGQRVQVLSYRYGLTGGAFAAVFLFTSTDGGRTFDAGRRVGTLPFSAAALGPGTAVSLTTHAYTTGLGYQRVPLDDAPAATEEAILSGTHLYSGAVGLAGGTTPVVVMATGSGEAQVRRHLGAGDPNSAATWSDARDIGSGDWMHLASGAGGLYLLAEQGDALYVRRFDGETFAAGTAIPMGTGELPQGHLAIDPGGRLHVVWPRIEVAGVRLYHATSDDGAAWSSRGITLDEGFNGVRLDVAADHRGFAVWATTPTGASEIHAMEIGP
jgi:hypothetical protein